MSMTDDEYRKNQEAYNDVMAWIDSLKPPAFIEWWEVENTGWTNGRSWFAVSHNGRDNSRFESQAEAIQYIADKRWDDDSVKWRWVHVTLQRSENQSITTSTWTEV